MEESSADLLVLFNKQQFLILRSNVCAGYWNTGILQLRSVAILHEGYPFIDSTANTAIVFSLFIVTMILHT